jgi:hypothetical protein
MFNTLNLARQEPYFFCNNVLLTMASRFHSDGAFYSFGRGPQASEQLVQTEEGVEALHDLQRFLCRQETVSQYISADGAPTEARLEKGVQALDWNSEVEGILAEDDILSRLIVEVSNQEHLNEAERAIEGKIRKSLDLRTNTMGGNY